MYRHPFDAISFFFGLLFTAGALSAMLVDDPWPFDRGGVWAIMLIVGGLGLLIAALRPGGDRQPATMAAVPTPVATVVGAVDPSMTEAHREIDEYLGEEVPRQTAEDPVTAEVVIDHADLTEMGPDDAVTAEVVTDGADPAEVGSDDAVTAEVVTESLDPVGDGTDDDPTTSPDEADGTGV